MTLVRTLFAATLALGLIASGCRAQAPRELVVSSDAELGAIAARLLPDLAARAGMELRAPVRIERRSRAELIDYLVFKLDQELPVGEATARVEAYALFGLMPEDVDLRGLLLELYSEQVAGFYEPDSTALFVLDDQQPEDLEALLLHELVHAVQDQHVDLKALTDPDIGNDRAAAAMAAIEGQATLVMLEYATEQMTGASVDLGQVPDFGAQIRPVLEAMNSQFPALARAPRVIRESLLFPYVEGAGFVQRLWVDGNRSGPFGDALPTSTEQVMRPRADPPVQVALQVHGGRVVLDDELGRLELGVLAEDVLGVRGPGGAVGAGGPAEGWDGDRYALIEDASGSRALVAAFVWENATARDRFRRAVDAGSGRFGGPVSLESIDVDGRALSVLHVGTTTALVSISLTDRR
ncbi:MAG: hypothetical protein OEN56_02965 [Gemmatimonadota bacterium]|nr:hypothetical protein [Gemmatimonadota bacterium]